MAINAGNSFRTRDKLNRRRTNFDFHRLEFSKNRVSAIWQSSRFRCDSSGKSFAMRRCRFATPRTFARWLAGAPAHWKRNRLMPAACCCRTSRAWPRVVISPHAEAFARNDR